MREADEKRGERNDENRIGLKAGKSLDPRPERLERKGEGEKGKKERKKKKLCVASGWDLGAKLQQKGATGPPRRRSGLEKYQMDEVSERGAESANAQIDWRRMGALQALALLSVARGKEW